VAFSYEFGCESASANDVCAGEWRSLFSACEGRAVFSLAYVDVDAPCNFQGVSSSLVWGVGVCMYGVVRSRVSRFMLDVTIDGAGIRHGVGGVCLDEFTEPGV
jgi:hypothetical protein